MQLIGEPLGDEENPRGVRGIVRDISDQKAQKQDLRLKDRVIEESNIGITIADANDPELPIVYANRGFEAITGYERAEIVGRNCRFLQGSGTDEDTIEELRTAITNEDARNHSVKPFGGQEYDRAPDHDKLLNFISYWHDEIEGPLHSVRFVHRKMISPGEWRNVTGEFSYH